MWGPEPDNDCLLRIQPYIGLGFVQVERRRNRFPEPPLESRGELEGSRLLYGAGSMLRWRRADDGPLDQWVEGGWHYVIFEVRRIYSTGLRVVRSRVGDPTVEHSWIVRVGDDEAVFQPTRDPR